MSEYQYYEFKKLDGCLTQKVMLRKQAGNFSLDSFAIEKQIQQFKLPTLEVSANFDVNGSLM